MQELFLRTEVLWFIAGLILLGGEILTSGFIIIFFGFGAWVVAVLSLIVDMSLDVQLTVFLLSSVVLLLFLRKKLSSVFKGERSDAESSYEDDIKGERAVVCREINPGVGGKVFFRGSEWDADSDFKIDKDEPVLITDRKSIRLIVEPINKKETE